MYTYVFLSSLGKASTISEKGLVTPCTVVGGTLVPSRSNGGPVEWLMSKHWKKSFHPSFVPLSSSYLFFSSLLLSFLYCFPSRVSRHVCPRTHDRWRTAKNKNGEGRIDRFIVGYHLQGALDKFWTPLTVWVHSPFSLHSPRTSPRPMFISVGDG